MQTIYERKGRTIRDKSTRNQAVGEFYLGPLSPTAQMSHVILYQDAVNFV
jgi:hypothetical protein